MADMPESKTLDSFLAQLDKLQGPPKATVRILQMLEDPDADLFEIAKLITPDSCLTANIFKTSNAAYYGFNTKASTVKDAIIRLGTSGVKTAVLASILEQSDIKPNKVFIELWKSALFTGLVSKEMGKLLKYPNPDICFTAGLLCDLGLFVINQLVGENFGTVLAEAKKRNLSMLEIEQAVVGFPHTIIGYKVAELWQFPTDYLEVIHYHHNLLIQPNSVTIELFRMLVAVHTANSLSPLVGDPAGYQIKMEAVVKAGYLISKKDLMAKLTPIITRSLQESEEMSKAIFAS